MSRVRENRMHGSRWRREESGTSRLRPRGAGASRRPYLDCARSSVTDELMGACDQANLLGPGFFGCLQEIGMEEQISIEPLPADDSFVFLTLDIQTERP